MASDRVGTCHSWLSDPFSDIDRAMEVYASCARATAGSGNRRHHDISWAWYQTRNVSCTTPSRLAINVDSDLKTKPHPQHRNPRRASAASTASSRTAQQSCARAPHNTIHRGANTVSQTFGVAILEARKRRCLVLGKLVAIRAFPARMVLVPTVDGRRRDDCNFGDLQPSRSRHTVLEPVGRRVGGTCSSFDEDGECCV